MRYLHTVAALAAVAAFPALAHAARPLSHFPVQVDGAVQGAVALADLTGDGRVEIIAGSGEYLTAVRSDNSLLPGFPVFLGSASVGSPAVADILSGPRAVLVVSREGRVHLIGSDGASWPGFPVSLDAGARAGGALIDLTGDGMVEVVAGGVDGKLHAWRITEAGPQPVSGFPVNVGAEITSAPSVGDLGGPQAAELTVLVGASDGGMHAFDSAGRSRSGFPVRSRFLISGSAAVGDVDDDGIADVVFASLDYRLYAVDAAGRSLAGFPIETGYRIHGGPALADLTGDGVPEVVFASSDRKLYAVGRGGRALPGFPVDLSGAPAGGVSVADLHRSGEEVIFVATEDRLLHAFDSRGRALDGWPISIEGSPSAAPSVSDLTGDGFLELVLGTRDGRLIAMKARRKGETPTRIAWATEGHDPARSGRRHPNSARFHDLSFEPARPMSTDDIEARWVFRHLDRVPEGEVELRWYRDGSEEEELRGQRRIESSHLTKGERWRFTVRAIDDGPKAVVFESTEVEIRNAPPTRPSVRILPEEPRVGARLTVDLLEASIDPDGDRVRYLYQWFRNDSAVDLPEDSSSLEEGRVRKKENWRVRVWPFDGELRGPFAEASVLVLNTPPTMPRISIRPNRPAVTDEIVAVMDTAPEDADGDTLENRYRWQINGEPTSLAESVNRLPAGAARKGQTVSVRVAAFDGEVEGDSEEKSVTLVNTPPTAPGIAIEPESPRTGDSLRAAIRVPSMDPDGDPIRYTYDWTLNGEDAEIDADVVDGERVSSGQRWSVRVISHDDEGAGGEASAETLILNTPPEPPVVTIVPPDPLPEQPLEARILVPESDRDGDSVSLSYVFSSPGRQRVEAARLPEGITRKGEVWTLTVTPNDGTESGRSAKAGVRIGNRPPPTPTVRIEPADPVGGTQLRAVAPLPTDPDGDEVRLSLRWTVDGTAVPELDDRMAVPGSRVTRGQVWSVSVSATDGEAWSGASSDSVRVERRPPVAPRVKVSPRRPMTTDPLRCEIESRAAHPDGDPIELSLLWYRDGELTSHVGETLSAEATRRGQSYSCAGTVVAASGTALGERSSQVTVVNSPPSRPEPTISPMAPKRDDALVCALASPSLDADGDELLYEWSWLRDGEDAGILESAVPEGRVRRGERWTCRVVPDDSQEKGPAAEHSVEIGNTPPSAPEVVLLPAEPAAGEDLRCEVTAPSMDPDGGEVSYQFRWYLDGRPQPFAPTSTEVRGRLIDAGSSWRCGVIPHDGVEDGPEGKSLEEEIGPGRDSPGVTARPSPSG